MAEFDSVNRVWSLQHGDLAYWVNADDTVSRCRVELITDAHVYVVFTANDHGRRNGERDRAGSWYKKRIVPREAVASKVTTTMRLKRPIMWDTVNAIPTPDEVLQSM